MGWVNASSGGQPEAMAPHQPSRGTLVAADRAVLQLSRSAAASQSLPILHGRAGPRCLPVLPASLLPGQPLWSLAPRGPWHTATCRDEGSKHRSRSSHSRASPGLTQHLLAGVEDYTLCKCLARLTKSCLETKSIQSCFPFWANQQWSCG